MSNPRSLTITIEAISDEHLRKLLELAIFDLSKIQENTWDMKEGASIPLTMTGDMGNYRLEYQLGSHEFIAAHRNLIEQGYSLVETTDWKTNGYSVYQHAENPPLRLYLTSAQIGEHDADEHQNNNIPF